MAFGIASNIASTRTAHDLSQVASDSALRLNRLTSGLAINSGREGGAQLSTSEGMRAEISGLTQGTRNAEHALQLLRTAEGGMNEISAILIRMREMAVQSSSTTLNDNNRESLDAEFGQLKETIDRIVALAHVSIGTQDATRASLAKLDLAINRLSTVRGEVGAVSNRLTHTVDFTANAIERVNASESTVRGTDFAWETSHLARNEIL